MGRFQFERPYVAEHVGTSFARAADRFLDSERKRRAAAEQTRQFDRTAEQGDRRIDQDQIRIEADAIRSGFDLDQGGGLTPAAVADTSFDEMPRGIGPDEFEDEPGFRQPTSAAPPTATDSGMSPGISAPNAIQVRHPTLGTYDYRRSTGAQQTFLQDELGRERETRQRQQTESDRARSIGNLTDMGRSEHEAGAIVDRNVNFDDVSPEYSRPGFREAHRTRLADQTSASIATAIGTERVRRQFNSTEGMTPADLDRLADNARMDYQNAQRELDALNKRTFIPPEEREEHQEALKAARDRVTTTRERASTYGAAADSVFSKATGVQFGTGTDGGGGKKQLTPDQAELIRRDPMRADYYRSRGYDVPEPQR